MTPMGSGVRQKTGAQDDDISLVYYRYRAQLYCGDGEIRDVIVECHWSVVKEPDAG